MRRTVFFIVTFAVALGAARLDAQTPPGIPPPFVPPFAASPTMYVNNTSSAATDLNNPAGTPTKPRRSIPTMLPAGAFVEVRGGPYSISTLTVTAQGTSSKPAVIRGVGSPVLQGVYGSRLILVGRYIGIEGLVLDSVAINMSPDIAGVWIRSCVVRNYSPNAHSAAIAVNGRYVVVRDSEIHHNGDANSPVEIDIPGVFVLQGAVGVWVINNHIHHNGGDGVLVGVQGSPEPWPRGVFIGGNTIHEDRENAVDIKQARDVIVSQNTIYGYQVRNSSAGEAIITHYNAELVWILNNRVTSSNRGIVSSGARGYVVLGNVITQIRHSVYENYSPTNLYASAGIITYNTSNSYHVNNTIWFSDAGISMPGGIDRTQVVGNIIGAGAHHIGFGSSQWLAASVVDRNLLSGMTPRFVVSGAVKPCVAPACIAATPLFANASSLDFRPLPGSPAIDANVTSGLYSAFQAYYGAQLGVDAIGGRRPVRAYDIGAVEAP
jgi:hypothetical protein